METNLTRQALANEGLGFEPTYKEWKPFSGIPLSSSPHRFEPTYKEWKHKFCHPMKEFLSRRFEPTYKEWKHENPPSLPERRDGFEPTYKEWKLAS